MKKIISSIAFFFVAVSSYSFTWKHSTPEAHGLKSSVIRTVFDGLKNKDVRSCVVVKDGEIVAEYFKPGYDSNSVFSVQSVSKSITSCLVGIAIEQGYIKSVDDPAYIYLPELGRTKDSRMKKITIKHLLNHTSGLYGTDTRIWNQWRNSEDWIDFILSRPMTAAPGTYFEYSTGNTHLLSAILENVTGKSLDTLAKENIFNKTGITSGYCTTDPKGIGDGGNGFYFTAYDMSRFGLLYQNYGNWEENQIVSKEWVAESTKVQATRPSTGSRYGYQFWIRNYGKKGYAGYCAQGYAGEFIFVVPEIELVVVFTSWYTGDTTFYYLYANAIVDSLQ